MTSKIIMDFVKYAKEISGIKAIEHSIGGMYQAVFHGNGVKIDIKEDMLRTNISIYSKNFVSTNTFHVPYNRKKLQGYIKYLRTLLKEVEIVDSETE